MIDQAALILRFGAQLQKLGGAWERVDGPVTARLALVTNLQEAGVQRILSWPAGSLPVPGILESLQTLGVQVLVPNLPRAAPTGAPRSQARGQQFAAEVEGIDVGLTSADAGFAASGTLLFRHGPGRPMLASQLSRRHIVLLPASRLFASLAAWLAGPTQAGEAPASILAHRSGVTLLTGPGRSRDIELAPALGVHGPRQLHVMVVEGI